MDVELCQCLMALPTLVSQMEEQSAISSVDINLIEWFLLRTELFFELLRVLTGESQKYSTTSIQTTVRVVSLKCKFLVLICVCKTVGVTT